jgi:hypothetical protein
MPVYRVHLDIVGVNAAKLQQFHDQVEARLAQFPELAARVTDWMRDGNMPALARSFRFTFRDPAHAAAFEDWVRANIQQLRTLVDGTLSRHICPHADPLDQQYDCRLDPRAFYREVAL